MTDPFEIMPPNYRWRVKRAPFGLGVEVKLQRRLFWRFWETVDAMIPMDDTSLAERVAWAKEELWYTESLRSRDRNDIDGVLE